MEPAGTPGTATLAFALDADGPATITVRARDGAVVKQSLRFRAARGLNVAAWNLLLDGAARRPAAPGEYQVTLGAAGRTAETSLRLDRFVRWTR